MDAYLHGFHERLLAMQHPGQELLVEPGIVALVGRVAGDLGGRILVTDDRALDLLAARLADLNARVVHVFDHAEACHRLVSAVDGHQPTRCTAMVCDALDAIPDLALPAPLRLRPVTTRSGDSDDVALADAAAAALRADPEMAPITDIDGFIGYLLSIPNARYLAAVDEAGAVRATAASANWGSTTGVYFVNTDPAWRGRGVGTAMTAAALRDARAAGAERAYLDASAQGLSIYLRLGFEPVGAITQFVRML
jgi:GNAT superfamily N-acetyltransferase